MKLLKFPFNIDLYQLTPDMLKFMPEVKTGEIYEPGTNNLKEDGLFSTQIFGQVGSKERDKMFGHIPLNTNILHPIVYKRLGNLKALYQDVLESRRFATWNEQTNDMESSDAIAGKTGYAFFMEHYKNLKFQSTGSGLRETRIKVIEKYRDTAVINRIPVLPAGLRDVQIDEKGRVSEDEINTQYRSIIATANTIASGEVSRNDPIVDRSRVRLQTTYNEVVENILNMLLKGKNSFGIGKFASRKVRNGTMQVISPMKVSSDIVGSPKTPKVNDIQVGLYQHLKAILPVTKHRLRNGFLAKVFTENSDTQVYLTNPKTLKKELVNVHSEDLIRWSTNDGIEKVINSFRTKDYRQKPIMISKHYLGLLYSGPEGFRLFQDIDELPKEFDRSMVYPINLTSLLYLSGYRDWNKFCAELTRYPVAGPGSTYIGNSFVKTTTKSFVRKELGEDWQPLGPDYVAWQFPSQDLKATFVETLSPHPSRIKGLSADYDGDRSTYVAFYSDLAIAEFERKKRERGNYVDTAGKLIMTCALDNIELVLRNITGGYRPYAANNL